jgi:antitoxin MazE
MVLRIFEKEQLLIAQTPPNGYTNDIHIRGEIMSLVAKWGHSLAIRLPKSVQNECRIKEGDEVQVSVSKSGEIVIKPVGRKQRLQALLDKVTPENLHGETDWGKPVGREEW